MLNSYSKSVVSNHVNSVSGNITKTYPKSFFKRFHLKSPLADNLLDKVPCMSKYGSSVERVQVIQMVVCGDMEVIAEIMWQKDYDEAINYES